MDASTTNTDSSAGHEPGTTLVVSSGVTSVPNHQGKVGSFSVQTLNGSQTMNSHNSGSAAPLVGTTAAGGSGTSGSPGLSVPAVTSGTVLSKGITAARMPPSSNSVIQTSVMNSQSVSQTAGPTVTLVRPPVHPAGPGTTLNGNNNLSPAAVTTTAAHTCVGIQTPHVSNSQPVSVSAGSHIIKQEPSTTIIQSAPQQTGVHGAVSAPRTPTTVAAGPGGIRALTPQMLAPRLPQTSPGQPGVHNIQLPPGE